MEAEFLTQYQAGKQIYEFSQKITSVETRLKSIEQDIHQKEDKLRSAQLSAAERNKIRAEIHIRGLGVLLGGRDVD